MYLKKVLDLQPTYSDQDRKMGGEAIAIWWEHCVEKNKK